MKIAISGAQSTGKSTLINELKRSFNTQFIQEITRDLKKQGYKINEEGDDKTQLKIMELHERYSLLAEDTFYDRCVLDGVVYTEYLFNENKISKETFEQALEIFKKVVNRYDIIFYLEPEFDIIQDGERSTSSSFRNNIVVIFKKYIHEYQIPVIIIKGTVEERVKKIKEVVNDFRTTNKEELYHYVEEHVEDDILRTFNTLWEERDYWKFKPLVFKEGNTILGFGAYTINERYPGMLKVYYLHVRSDQRGKKIAKKLLLRMSEIAVKNNVDMMYVTEESTDGSKIFKNFEYTIKNNEFGTKDYVYVIPKDELLKTFEV